MRDISNEVLERVNQGDMAAFEEVYRAASGFVYNVALRITQSGADAEEVTQDVFMKVYRSLKNFGFRSSFKTWVYRITVNTAINRYRQSAKHQRGRVDHEGLIESVPAQGSSAEQAIRNDNEQQLDKLIGALSEDHRACIVLREIEGLSYEEIAASLNIPVNTVRSRLKRAREALLQGAGKEAGRP